ncbi:MAG: 4-hydroxy-3-methylbut-2-enyl diphosphate reductase, partial [Thermodesulfovibrionales bacterium]
VAKRAGFCFGVKRAVDIAFERSESETEGLYTFGPIIHNPQVIERLSQRGVIPIDNINRDDIKTLIIRTHGIPLTLLEEASKRGYKIIDATCPFVKKAQNYAKLLRDEGHQVIILGDREHPEVKGLVSYAGDDAIVINGKELTHESLRGLKNKVGVVVQTTQPLDNLKLLIGMLIEHSKELKIYNTICNSTALRLKETEELARKVDIMIVVGGRNSANTTQLANLCRSIPIRTHHIEMAEELREEWFEGISRVGVTAGASTPEWIIREVERKIKDIGGIKGDGD